MAVSYLKKASKTAVSSDPEVRPIMAEMLAAIEAGGEEATRDYARKLDGLEGDILLSKTDLAEAARISRLEGMEGHAVTGDGRLAKCFPNERFELSSGLSE